MNKTESNFRDKVHALVCRIPYKRIMTYGQIAYLCGSPRAARIVGVIAHGGDQELPWHRVVHKDGRLATGYPGGVEGQRKHLEEEDIRVGPDYRVDVTILLWEPNRKHINAQQ